MKSKSISPLLGAVILLAITISIAYISAYTLSSLVQKQTSSTTKESTCVASFQISNAFCKFSPPLILNSTKVLLHLDNSLTDEENLDNNLTLINGEENFVTGKNNNALYFNGTFYGEIENTNDFNPNEITIELWVKPE